MAKDVLIKIAEAEGKAEQIVSEAKKEYEEIITDAKKEAEKNYEDAYKKCQELLSVKAEQALVLAKEDVKDIIAKAEEMCLVIESTAAKNKNAAIDAVIRKVVGV